MIRLRNFAAACAIALVVAACGTIGGFNPETPGFGVRTEWTGDVPSGCEKGDAAYDAHMMACRAKPKAKNCTSAIIAEANKVNEEVVKFCVAQPESTPANVAKIDGLVAKQLAVGRPK